ncbi:MAG TPA: cupredoxin family copper-binding protein [Steroidobacteraceae bacterium]
MPISRIDLTALLLLGLAPWPALQAADAPAIAAAAQTTVSIHDFMFSPMALQVTAGTTVTWTNLDPEPHTIRSVDDSFRSGALDQNDSFTFRFDKPGTYKYGCSIHPQMIATVVVK